MELILELTLMCIHWKIKTFVLKVTVTLTVTQLMLITQTSHSRLTVQTVDLLYLQSTGLWGVQVGHHKHSHTTSLYFPT
jgi:hypothetical protein